MCKNWLSITILNSNLILGALHQPTKFQADTWYPSRVRVITESLRPGSSLSWKISKFHGTCKNWWSMASLNNNLFHAWWRYQMETFSPFLAICAGNSLVTNEFHAQRPVTSDVELWCFFDLRLNKRLTKQWWGWWFEMPSCPLWCYSNGYCASPHQISGEYLITW